MSKLKEFLKAIRSLVPSDKQADFDKAAEGVEDEPTPPAPVKTDDIDVDNVKHNGELVKRLVQQNEAQRAQIDKLLTEIGERNTRDKQREEALTKQQQDEQDQKVEDAIKAARDKGKIAKEDETAAAKYRALMKADFDAGKYALDALPDNPAATGKDATKVVDDKGKGTDTGGGRAALMEQAANAFATSSN